MIFVADSGIDRSMALRSRPAGSGFLRRRLAVALKLARTVMNATRSRMWMMSARGTITSTMRRSRNARMFLSMMRSAGEKPVSPAPSSSTSVRSARMLLDFQRKIARSVRVNQLSALSGVTWLGRGSGTGRLRDALGSLGLGGSASGMETRQRCEQCRDRARRVGQGSRFRAFPLQPPRRRSRDRSLRDEGIHAPRDGQDDVQRVYARRALHVPSSRRRLRYHRAGGLFHEHGAGPWRERTARWLLRL